MAKLAGRFRTQVLRTRPAVVAGIVTMALIAVVLGVVLVVRIAPHWLARTDDLYSNEAAEEIGRTRTALLAVLAGFIATAGAVFTALSYRLNRAAHELDRQGQITERFTRATDQLDSANSVDRRLGGIYALERIARESPADHGPIVEILTAYVREHARPESPEEEAETEGSPRVRVDIQAILTVLGRRNVEHDPPPSWRLDLHHAGLSGADLRRARLPRAHLVSASLQDADLRDADLEASVLIRARLEGADLSNTQLRGASFQRARLRGASLVGAQLQDSRLGGAHLESADLSAAILDGAVLIGAHLNDADLSGARLSGAQLRGAQLEGATLTGAVVSEKTRWPDGFDWRRALGDSQSSEHRS